MLSYTKISRDPGWCWWCWWCSSKALHGLVPLDSLVPLGQDFCHSLGGQLRPPQFQARVSLIFLLGQEWIVYLSDIFGSILCCLTLDEETKVVIFFSLGVRSRCQTSATSRIKGSLFQMVKQKRLNSWSCLVLWILKQTRLEKNICCIVEFCFLYSIVQNTTVTYGNVEHRHRFSIFRA